jgi:hypothetical protein
MKSIIALSLFVLSFTAYSKCEISYDRTACKNKEVESYAKCENKKTCTKAEAAEDIAECQEAAMLACKNTRIDITKTKVINAKWNGKEILSKTNKKDFCEDYSKRLDEYNKCL